MIRIGGNPRRFLKHQASSSHIVYPARPAADLGIMGNQSEWNPVLKHSQSKRIEVKVQMAEDNDVWFFFGQYLSKSGN